MRGLVRMIAILAVLSGCDLPGITTGVPDISLETPHIVRGRIHGLWDGADGVALRLQANGVDRRFTVSANGPFRLDEPLAPGTSYTVTVANDPARHTCKVASGDSGMIADDDRSNLEIACTGPRVEIDLSGGRGWTFDETEESQSFSGSITLQDVALTIHSDDVTSASIDGAPAVLEVPSRAIAMPIGERTVPVVVTATGGLTKTYTLVFERDTHVHAQTAYVKASRVLDHGSFGYAVALSGDTMAIGASGESSAATGVNGDQDDDTAIDSGAVYVFIRRGTTWVQQAYIKASNTESDNFFGLSVALSGDTLAIGAPGNTSAITGINGDQSPGTLINAGAAYVFVRRGGTWTQQAYIKPSNTHARSAFGSAVALYGDTLAVGAPGERGASSGINQDPWNLSPDERGAAYLFVRRGATWTQEAYIKASNPGAFDEFGAAVAVSTDTLVVSAPGEQSATRGINGDQTNDLASGSGAVYVFVRDLGAWRQQAYVKASNTERGDGFGRAIALDGNTLAVAAPWEKSAATKIDGDQSDNSMNFAGAVYMFVRDRWTWAQQAYIKQSHGGGQVFGSSIALSGHLLAVGAYHDANAATGIDPSPQGEALMSGAAYVFLRDEATWREHAYVKASNTHAGDGFGVSVALGVDTLVVGAPWETSSTTGIDGDQHDTSLPWAGAVYVFH